LNKNLRFLVALGCACVLSHAAPSPSACAQAAGRAAAPTEPLADQDAIAFVLGNIEFLLLHEIAHFLIMEKNVPIIGPEESAADYIATLALIREAPLDPAQQDRGLQFLLAAADAFAAAWQTGAAQDAEVPYWGSHALGLQRYYQIACLLYGSDPVLFERVPDTTGLPPARAQGCVAEYAKADEAIQWLLANYGRQADDPPGAATEILYERPRTLVETRVLQELESLELLERTVERLHERFTLERPFTLVMRGCGQAEAAWIADRRELVICYDLIDMLYLLSLQAQTGASSPVSVGEE
jgi:Putative metallopeptidase